MRVFPASAFDAVLSYHSNKLCPQFRVHLYKGLSLELDGYLNCDACEFPP